jgi:hypothetical protein
VAQAATQGVRGGSLKPLVRRYGRVLAPDTHRLTRHPTLTHAHPPRSETAMQPFVINSHGRMVFPANFLPELDFTVITDLDHLAAVIRRDFEAKAPSGTDILRRVEEGGHYSSRYELMRDIALNLFWTNRFAMTSPATATTCTYRCSRRGRTPNARSPPSSGSTPRSPDVGRRRRGPRLRDAVRRPAPPAHPRHRAADPVTRPDRAGVAGAHAGRSSRRSLGRSCGVVRGRRR